MAEVFFCNHCDQSVPLVEIEEGHAFRSGDRVLCSSCREHLEDALLPRNTGGGRGLVLALFVGLIGWAAAGGVWFQARQAREGLATGLESRLAGIERDLASQARSLREQLAKEGENRSLLGGQVAALRDEQAGAWKEAQSKLQTIQATVEQFQQFAVDMEKTIQKVEELDATFAVTRDRLSAQRSAQEGLRDELARLSDRVKELDRTASAERRKKEAASEFSPEIAALLRQLQDDDPEVRYNALERLQKVQDPKLLPHILPLLADPYEFTRFLAAHTLGEWGARPAVPHLIEALMDEVGFVRQAAVTTLRRLTGQNFGYDHNASLEERRKGYRSWKTWWAANGEAFLAGEG